MACEACENIQERDDIPHVVSDCPGCGRELHIVKPGKNGIGLRVEKGDKIRFPAGWLTMSPDPLKSRGQFTSHGIDWFAKQIFMQQFPREKGKICDELASLEERNDQLLRASPLLDEWDIDDPEQGQAICELLSEDKSKVEFWAMMSGVFARWSVEAINANDIQTAVWAAVGAERTRALTVFKESFENVVLMGHSAKRIIDVLNIWDQNKDNSNEGFWQATFTKHSYVLSQVFASPMVFIGENASVAGMNIDRTGTKFVDYLYAMESSRESIVIEIKTPTVKLLGRKYRGVYPPSRDLAGAVVQVLDYRRELIRKVATTTADTDYDLEAFDPKCALIVGNAADQLTNAEQRKSFELFQASQKDVEIVTYDNLFRKSQVLASLFSLVQSQN